MTLDNGDKKYIQMALRLNGIKNTEGLKIALAPKDDESIDLVLIPRGTVLANYELEEGETINALADAIQDLLEGSDVRAPSA